MKKILSKIIGFVSANISLAQIGGMNSMVVYGPAPNQRLDSLVDFFQEWTALAISLVVFSVIGLVSFVKFVVRKIRKK